MIITTVRNNRLFIQFDRIVKKGKIWMTGKGDFELEIEISDTDFEVVTLPDNTGSLNVTIDIENEKTITRIINKK